MASREAKPLTVSRESASTPPAIARSQMSCWMSRLALASAFAPDVQAVKNNAKIKIFFMQTPFIATTYEKLTPRSAANL
jgi:hypothetical protein